MLKDLTPSQKKLAGFMSEISERCYYSGWQNNLEYILWEALDSGPRKYGHDFITDSDINMLKALVEKTRSWIIFGDSTEETSIDLQTWAGKYQTDTNNDPSLLDG